MTATVDPATFDRKAFLYAWADYLESGRFTQGRGQLKSVRYAMDAQPVTFHCCLGVACELAADMGILSREGEAFAPPGLDPFGYEWAEAVGETSLPPLLAELLTGDRETVDPKVFGLDGGHTYSEVNDASVSSPFPDDDVPHMSFREIAATIRAWADSLP